MLISLRGVDKEYIVGEQPFLALKDVDLEIGAGELVFVIGTSGSGKSTLLNMIAGLDRPSHGEVEVAGQPIHGLDEDGLSRFRAANVGVVFQFFQLLPTLTVAENVLLAMDLARKVPPASRRTRALELLDRVGVADHADKLPAALSGGQQQRVAIARALANDPPLVVADEPTGNLDSQTAERVMTLVDELHADGKTVLLVTHDSTLSGRGGRVIRIADGRVS